MSCIVKGSSCGNLELMGHFRIGGIDGSNLEDNEFNSIELSELGFINVIKTSLLNGTA